jgi:predicted nucleic acid-binding protein
MPELVICNTSPLFYLHRLRHLEILQQLYHQLVVPEAVRDELHVGRAQGEDAPELEVYTWITMRTVRVPEGYPTDHGFGARRSPGVGARA